MLKAVNVNREHHEVTRVAGNNAVNVWYDHDHDTVALEVGATTINMQTSHFFQMHEMMRKAAARLVMQAPEPSSAVLATESNKKEADGQLYEMA